MQAQVLVNESWSTLFGTPSETGWSASRSGMGGNIYTVGHSLSGSLPQLWLSCHDEDGNLLWSSGLDAPGLTSSFGAALLPDAQGNIYIAGAAAGSGTNGFDFLVARFDSTGSQSWYTVFDGPDELDDYGVAIMQRDTQSIFLTGLSDTDSEGQNIMAARVSTSGSVLWEKYYDYAGKDDAPIGIEAYNASNIDIIGGSRDASGEWSALSWRLPANGSSSGIAYRYAFPGLDYQKGLYYQKDSLGYYYFCGNIDADTTGLDIQLIKLSSGFVLQWEKTIDGGFGDDAAYCLALDEADEAVYLGGHSANRKGGQDMLVASFTAAGAVSMEQRRRNNQAGALATARAIQVAADGGVYAAGEANTSEGKGIVLTRFSKEEGQLWEKKSGTAPDNGKQAYSLLPGEDGKLVFSGIVMEGETRKYVLKALEELNLDRDIVLSEDSLPSHVKGEVIIRFAPAVLDSHFVNNKKLHYSPLCGVVADTALLSDMEQVMELPAGEDICGCKAIKVFPGLDTEELCITDLDGNPLYIPPLWTTLILKDCSTGKNEQELSAALDSISAGRIMYAHPNYAGTGDAPCEDALCNDQHSLWDTPSPAFGDTASINILPAWDVSTGKPEVKVGIFDSGIFYDHEDFGDGAAVEESWSFIGGNFMTIADDPLSHGTRGAGIIGAFRGNDVGIAGIAGGDTGEPGVTLFGFGVINNGNMWAISDYVDALAFSVMQNGSPIIDLANNSLSNPVSSETLEEAINLAYHAGIALVTSRGNGFAGWTLNEASYPCSLNDDWTICVGASGTDGLLKDDTNDDDNLSVNLEYKDYYHSLYGSPMDLLAPGTTALISTTINIEGGYDVFNGTSAAAPHVTGVAALLASASEEVRLAVEDIEHVLEYTATDLDSAYYDQKTGWGRLNAGAALEFIQDNRILHFSEEPEPTLLCDHSITNAVCVVEMQGPYLESETGYSVNTGDELYETDIIQYTWNINLDICALTNDPNATIVHSSEKPGFWVRNSASTLWGQPEIQEPPNVPTEGRYGVKPYELVQFIDTPYINGCIFQGELIGYSYRVYDNGTGENLEAIMPAGLAHCESPRLAISLLVQSENPVSTNEPERANWRLFP
ncbi:MAG: S8 family serine peptidase, partial [Phaeodactylibacter sp.]|nr:S8 family serine peptidase [Phaeodactylibacter sp.]